MSREEIVVVTEEKLSVVNMNAVAKEFRQGGTDVIYSRELLAGVNLHITARCITFRGGQPSSMYPHLAA
ncbi:hypothetical protein CesoFtcFv8_007574 [Champsocephalus esox]|uniref:Uncharacterized protein n=1 Tax=Champsocephalus esox TaxID=159716 RepID=A0AAN8CEC1_9TELE|nr:hypothetical protein CesoFtcFv8_007574 [Champsocephalus esox]